MVDTPEPSSLPPQRWGLWPTLGWSLCIFALFVLSQTVVALVAVALTAAQNPDVDPGLLSEEVVTSGLVLSIATLVSNPLCIGSIALLIRQRGRSVKRYLELHRPNWLSLVMWCGITLALIYGIDYLKTFVDRPPSSFATDIYSTAQFIPLLYLAVAIAAPLFEEIFFRGFLFQGLYHSFFGAWGATLISALFWAVIHLQYDQYDMAGIFAFGVVLAIAQLRTHSLYVPIAMHALNNFLALSHVSQG